MSLYLNTNVSSLNAQRNFRGITANLNKTIERLSTGLKINRASDGAGSLLAANYREGQRRGSDVAISNIQQGLHVLNIADGGVRAIEDELHRLREIALEASNATVTFFGSYSTEVTQITNNINNIANGTTFGVGGGAISLLNGTAGAFNIQAGPNSGGQNVVDIGSTGFSDNTLAGLAITQTTIASNANATTLLGEVDAAFSTLSTNIATIGGLQGQLENRLQYMEINVENLAASEAVLRNADVAAETARLTQFQILQQASAVALSTANQAPSIALALLQ